MTESVSFYLNGSLVTLPIKEATETALDALRIRLGLCGTKEGCAEGDCGACTILVGSCNPEGMRYRAVNACILFLPELDGKDVLSIEGVAGHGGELHPVQQAMVEAHASQCGFCTPGFVMMLTSHYMNDGANERRALSDALAGNLCRCTGYGPILDAGMRMGRMPADEREDHLADAARRLELLERSAPLDVATADSRYRVPRDIRELMAMLADTPDATLLAGGTDIGLWVTKQGRQLSDIISLNAVHELARYEADAGAFYIGALVRYSDMLDKIAGLWPDFDELLRRLGSVQVRNSGTIGGNIANGSPIGDTMPPLIALGARLRLIGPDGEREMPLEDYFIDYGKQDRRQGEIVASIILPRPAPDQMFYCDKISKRFDQDISALLVAIAFRVVAGTIIEPRIACGGLAATPKRARHAEAALAGKPLSEATFRAAMDALEADFTPISDMRASAVYRMEVARNLLLKAWLRAGEGEDVRSLALRETVDAG